MNTEENNPEEVMQLPPVGAIIPITHTIRTDPSDLAVEPPAVPPLTLLEEIKFRGWVTTEPMEVSDAFALANDLIIVRGEGEVLDAVFTKDFHREFVE